jgi:leucyl/phenylalanyl-tRNA--protein transferase
MSGPQNSRLTSDSLLRAYMMGVFPMAEDVESNELFWVDPDYRGILPLDKLYVSRSLRKTIRKQKFTVTFDKSFREVIENCRAKRDNRETSWINDEILTLYCDLHERGHAHSIECWQDDKLVGGLYGVSLGAAFFGESMFSLASDASKTALVYLVARLLAGGYVLLDTQFLTDHLQSLGAINVPRGRYHSYLQEALETPADFYSLPVNNSPHSILQLIDHKS